MKDELAGALFAAGAYVGALERGMSGATARDFAGTVCKEAAARRVRWNEDEEDEEDTWWNRNKHWALPTAIGAGAFLLGADAGRNGRADRSYLSNAGGLFLERLKAIFGIQTDPLYKSLTSTSSKG